MWAEDSGLSLDAPPPWSRTVFEQHGTLVPLDSLVGANGRDSLSGTDRLVLAQPRALSPEENVALDGWVRRGGRLLVLADPMYTGHSAYALGDPRRPQAIAMLSPILGRWGLRLEFDSDQPPGERQASVMGAAIPVELAGRFALSGGATCKLWDDGLAATCAIGKGRVMAVADATLLDPDRPNATALSALLDAAFAVR